MMAALPVRQRLDYRLLTDAGLVAIAYTLWSFPIVLGARTNWPLRTALVLPLILIVLFRIAARHEQLRLPTGDLGTGLLAAYVVAWVLAFARTLARGPLTVDGRYILGYGMYLLGFLAFLSHTLGMRRLDEGRMNRVAVAALLSGPVYAVANVVAFAAGLRQPDIIYLAKYPAQMLSVLGVEWNRTLFPFADGINGFGVFAGMTLVLLSPLVARTGPWPRRVLAGIMGASCIAAMLMTDSRGALLFSGVVLSAAALPRRWARFARWMPFVVSFVPLFLIATLPASWAPVSLPERPSGTMDAANRMALEAELCREGAESGVGAFSNRSIVWRAGLRELWPPETIDLVGYGFRGQVFAGIPSQLACIFLSLSQRHLVSTHNVWLQSVFEIGYIGTALLLALTIWVVRRLSALSAEPGDTIHAPMLGAAQYLILAGSLEATLSPDYGATYVFFLVIAFLTVLARAPSSARAAA